MPCLSNIFLSACPAVAFATYDATSAALSEASSFGLAFKSAGDGSFIVVGHFVSCAAVHSTCALKQNVHLQEVCTAGCAICPFTCNISHTLLYTPLEHLDSVRA
jgi:hypothetical protein